MAKTVKLVVYGTLMSGGTNHAHYMGDAKLLGEVTISGFDMFNFGGFPALIKGNGVVRGELYEVPDEAMPAIDRLEGAPTFYARSKVRAKLPQGAQLDAFVYVLANPKRGEGSHRVKPVDGVLDWRTRDRGLKCA